MAENPVWWRRLGGRWAEQNAAAVINQRRIEEDRVARLCARLGEQPIARPGPQER